MCYTQSYMPTHFQFKHSFRKSLPALQATAHSGNAPTQPLTGLGPTGQYSQASTSQPPLALSHAPVSQYQAPKQLVSFFKLWFCTAKSNILSGLICIAPRNRYTAMVGSFEEVFKQTFMMADPSETPPLTCLVCKIRLWFQPCLLRLCKQP